MLIEVRPYGEADQDGVLDLWSEVFPDSPLWNNPLDDIRRKLGCQPEGFLVAFVNGEVAGTSMAGFDGHRGWIYYVGVLPKFRRLGLGTALMRRAEEYLTTAGCPKLNLQVRMGNTDAVAFYESLGYHVEERISMGKLLWPT
jgi:ribosomal protein S18 acetylase RimI-like enzyme